jgi:hypothetical protein
MIQSFKLALRIKKSKIRLNEGLLINKWTYQIHIDTLKTPNPNFLKFVPMGKEIMGTKGSLDIVGPQYA